MVYEDIVLDVDIGSIQGGGPESEDCLFLDLVVPGKAIRGEQTLPVINYIYGGKPFNRVDPLKLIFCKERTQSVKRSNTTATASCVNPTEASSTS